MVLQCKNTSMPRGDAIISQNLIMTPRDVLAEEAMAKVTVVVVGMAVSTMVWIFPTLFVDSIPTSGNSWVSVDNITFSISMARSLVVVAVVAADLVAEAMPQVVIKLPSLMWRSIAPQMQPPKVEVNAVPILPKVEANAVPRMGVGLDAVLMEAMPLALDAVGCSGHQELQG